MTPELNELGKVVAREIAIDGEGVPYKTTPSDIPRSEAMALAMHNIAVVTPRKSRVQAECLVDDKTAPVRVKRIGGTADYPIYEVTNIPNRDLPLTMMYARRGRDENICLLVVAELATRRCRPVHGTFRNSGT